MVTVGYHASHEQHAPSRLRSHLVAAEQAGFTAGMCSDHFHPWSEQQGQSGFAWSWLGAALEATQLPMGVVNAPGQRYHPAIIAQAAATLAEMYPERFWLAVGSGQDLNEHITGEAWPRKADRDQRLLESVEVIRALWRGETVTHRGAVVVEDAHLYTRPERPPRLLGAALTPRTAQWVGGWDDGMVTIAKPHEELREIVEAFRAGGGQDKHWPCRCSCPTPEPSRTRCGRPTRSGGPTSSTVPCWPPCGCRVTSRPRPGSSNPTICSAP